MKATEVIALQAEYAHWFMTDTGRRFCELVMEGAATSERAQGMFPDSWTSIDLAYFEYYWLNKATSYYVNPDMTMLTKAAARTMPLQPLRQTDLPTPHGFVVFNDQMGDPETVGMDMDLIWQAALWTTQHRVDSTVLVVTFFNRVESFTKWRDVVMEGKRDWNASLRVGDVRWDNVISECSCNGWMMSDMQEWGLDFPQLTTFNRDVQIVVDDALHIRELMTFWTLCQQRISRLEQVHADRATARRLDRKHPGTARSTAVVRLRRESTQTEPTEHTTEKREHDHRWMVEGHWRNQWLPSVKGHRLQFIAPYIKGPEDKPLVITKKVFKWDR